MTFGSILILSIRYQGKYFYFVSLIIFFINTWWFNCRNISIPWWNLLRNIFFLDIVNWIYSLNFFVRSSLICIKIYCNCMFVTCYFINRLKIITVFLLECFCFSMYNNMSSAKMDNLISSFPILMPFVSFFTRIFSLNILVLYWVRGRKRGHMRLAPDQKDMFSDFSHYRWFGIYSFYDFEK